MKIHEFTMAPNPRRVRVFLAEKGIEVPSVQIDIGKGENRKPEFLAKNPMGAVPVLELDDGTYISESLAICRYLEELNPDPSLFGSDAEERALIEMWTRRMEAEIFQKIAGCFQNTHDYFKGRISQIPEYGEVCKKSALKSLEWLDGELADRKFIAGDRYTIADIIAMTSIDFGRVVKIGIQPDQKNLVRWHKSVSSRPSAKA